MTASSSSKSASIPWFASQGPISPAHLASALTPSDMDPPLSEVTIEIGMILILLSAVRSAAFSAAVSASTLPSHLFLNSPSPVASPLLSKHLLGRPSEIKTMTGFGLPIISF
jgi:hypothetical protein